VCLWGAPGTGKTVFRRSLCGGSSEPSFYTESRGILKLLGKFWNVCIGEQYDGCDELREVALDGANLLMIACDLTDKDSISRILTYNIPEKFPIVIVGLKSDIVNKKDKNSVKNEDIDKLMAATHAILYAEGCAKNTNDCTQIIEEAMSAALEWYELPENKI
jgi:GTPase SAR1 family protein